MAGESGLEGPGNLERVPLEQGAPDRSIGVVLCPALSRGSGVTALCPAHTDRPGRGRKG